MKQCFLFIIACFLFANNASAIVLFDQYDGQAKEKAVATGYLDFVPVGFFDENENYVSVFKPLIDASLKAANFELFYNMQPTYEKNLETFSDKKSDFFIGCSADTYDFRNLDIVYPAIFSSPVSIISLPTKQIFKIEELKLKNAGIAKEEHFSDFIKSQMKNYNVKEFENYNQMFEALFNNEIDFIFSNYYYGIVKISELGLNNQVVLSKTPIWNNPLFICINSFSPNAKKLYDFFEKYSKDEDVRKKTKESLIKIIQEIKIKNMGVVAPSYIKEKK